MVFLTLLWQFIKPSLINITSSQNVQMFQINKTRRIQPQLQSRRPQKWLVQRAAFSANKIFFGIFPLFSACCLANSHCDFHFVWKQFFEEKKRKKIIEDKRLQSLFLWVKRKEIDTLPVCLQICHLRF